MSTCPNCENRVAPGAEQCHFCGRIFHHTHNLVLKKDSRATNTKVPVYRRICAGMIDILYMSTPAVLSLFFLEQSLKETTLLQFFSQSWFLFLLFAVLQIFLLVHDGQTIGKKAMKIAIVVHESHDHPSPFQILFLRGIVPILPFIIPYLGVALFGLNLAWGLGEEQRCLHDFIAGTDVVNE